MPTHTRSTEALQCSLPWPLTAGCKNLTVIVKREWMVVPNSVFLRYHLGRLDNLKKGAFSHSWVYVSTRGQKRKETDDLVIALLLLASWAVVTQGACTMMTSLITSPWALNTTIFVVQRQPGRQAKADSDIQQTREELKGWWGGGAAIFIDDFPQLMMERNFKSSVISDTEQNTDRNRHWCAKPSYFVKLS